jgi:hypothetical protein
MITKFIRKRNPNQSLSFGNLSARIQVHSNGSQTFKFKKTVVTPAGTYRIQTEAGLYLTNESGLRLITG